MEESKWNKTVIFRRRAIRAEGLFSTMTTGEGVWGEVWVAVL
jgi:hypothetical protein